MSKKSRKRNKKILGALAAGLGAMALAKRKKASIAGMDDAGIGVTHPALSAINKASNVASKVADAGSNFQSRFKSKIGNKWVGPGEASGIADKVTNVVPHFPTHKRVHVGRGVFKSGGSAKKAKVTGAAKRGFGRALMKGKK